MSYQDPVKYMIFCIEIDGDGWIEVQQGIHRIDLVDVEEFWHEKKIFEVNLNGELAKVVRYFMQQVQRETAGRDR